MTDENIEQEEVVLEENQLVCLLTNDTKKATNQELNLQSIIRMLNEEYGFGLVNIKRDFKVEGVDENDKKIKFKADLAIFEAGVEHIQDNIIRVCIIHDEKVKETDAKKGLVATLQNILVVTECEFGLWSNGPHIHFLQRSINDFDATTFSDLSDFPGEGENLEDLDRKDRSVSRNPANDSLIKVFKRSHDYIYGNEGRKKDAFWQLLNLIFCKLYDEKQQFNSEKSYRREFYVGVTEQNTEEGRKAIATRIKNIFEKLKEKGTIYTEVFDGSEAILLTDKGLSVIAAELSKYSFLNASIDVKGAAYETIVDKTLKDKSGQFFTPRNIIKTMVAMLNPQENERVLDPACGSGGFLVMVLDHVRNQIAQELYPTLSGAILADKLNTSDVNERVKSYSENCIFGFDFDPDLKKAARMNMVMSGDGHSNVFHVNSLAYPKWEHPTEINKIQNAIEASLEIIRDEQGTYDVGDARGKFDVIFTNPPFGAKVEVEKEIANRYELSKYSDAPEVLFIEACYNYLKPKGRMAIVLPDGILGNPNMLRVREWILNRFRVLASIDLAVEAFMPQVGVQASLLFLQKKTNEERQLAQEIDENYEIFMAIAEKLGKDRRGNPIYLRDDDGAEIIFEETVEYLVARRNDTKELKYRKEKRKRLDDDLPLIATAYQEFLTQTKKK